MCGMGRGKLVCKDNVKQKLAKRFCFRLQIAIQWYMSKTPSSLEVYITSFFSLKMSAVPINAKLINYEDHEFSSILISRLFLTKLFFWKDKLTGPSVAGTEAYLKHTRAFIMELFCQNK